MSLKEAGALLVDACSRAIDGDGPEAALRWLVTELDEAAVSWLVTEPVNLLLVSRRRVTMGRSTYTAKVPREAARRVLPEFLERLNAQCFVSTDVVARNAKTARILAREVFADSASVLDLIDPRAATFPDGDYLAIPESGPGGINFSRSPWILDGDWFGGNGRLISPFPQPSDALKKREDERTDWERRVVASIRWLSRAQRSTTTVDRLVSLMVALESLFIENRREHDKGRLIAQRLSERMRVRTLSRQQQETWIAELYKRRNDAVHEGREYVNDLEVEQLLDLVRYTVRYAAEHLVAKHHTRHACRSFNEAMMCRIWYGASG
jgi:hypothetical protein